MYLHLNSGDIKARFEYIFHRGDTWPRIGYDCPNKIQKKEKWKGGYVNTSEHLIFRRKRESRSQMEYTKC